MKKTNATRFLDRLNISYAIETFEPDRSDKSAEKAAELLAVPPGQIYKTLIARGEQSGVIIASVPGGRELDLKALARLSENKKVELVPLKEVRLLTGYERGSVSPLGMKKRYPLFMDESAFEHNEVIISAGAPDSLIRLSPRDLAQATGAVCGSICR